MLVYGALVGGVVLRHGLPRRAGFRLVGTLVLVSTAHVAASPLVPGSSLDLVASTLLACAGVLWASAAFVKLRASLADEHQRLVWVESCLLAMEGTNRGALEAMHELKSIVSGLAKASQLLTDTGLSTDVRHRLEQTLNYELSRMGRLLWHAALLAPAVIDLDRVLDAVLDLHRIQGQVFTWTPNGTNVVGRQDALAEALDILLDNAVRHGGAATGRVDVSLDDVEADTVRIAVSDAGPGVPAAMRHSIFKWGERGLDSTGQGIGLNLARRLVTEQGGSLTLAEEGIGSSFVIRLPAARRSEETYGALIEHASL